MAQREVIVLDQSTNRPRLFSDAIKVGKFIYTSGQGPVDPQTGKTIEGDILAQTRQTLENCKSILKKAGSNLEKVIKVSIFLKDISDYPEVNKVYHEYFFNKPPARSCFAVSSLAREDWRIEIEIVSIS
jgi:2-iminobutanoate/2-iminopropanoate deaminase